MLWGGRFVVAVWKSSSARRKDRDIDIAREKERSREALSACVMLRFRKRKMRNVKKERMQKHRKTKRKRQWGAAPCLGEKGNFCSRHKTRRCVATLRDSTVTQVEKQKRGQ